MEMTWDLRKVRSHWQIKQEAQDWQKWKTDETYHKIDPPRKPV